MSVFFILFTELHSQSISDTTRQDDILIINNKINFNEKNINTFVVSKNKCTVNDVNSEILLICSGRGSKAIDFLPIAKNMLSINEKLNIILFDYLTDSVLYNQYLLTMDNYKSLTETIKFYDLKNKKTQALAISLGGYILKNYIEKHHNFFEEIVLFETFISQDYVIKSNNFNLNLNKEFSNKFSSKVFDCKVKIIASNNVNFISKRHNRKILKKINSKNIELLNHNYKHLEILNSNPTLLYFFILD